MLKIAVIGSGQMGQGIAWTFAREGHEVMQYHHQYDEKKITKVCKFYNVLGRVDRKAGLVNDSIKEAIGRINHISDLNDVRECDYVIECVVEDIEVKKRIFSKIDEVVKKDTVLATNTSSLSITEISSCLNNLNDNVIGLHFFNPAPTMELVEIVKGLNTSSEVVEKCSLLVSSINKQAVIVEEYPGFIVNRLIMPMINEAVHLLDVRVASAKEIDMAMKLGANHPLGPLELADLIGIDVVYAILKTLYSETGEVRYKPAYTLKKMQLSNKLGRKVKSGFYEY